MKVTITRACGHEEVIEVLGKASDRENRIHWEEQKVCNECYHTEQAEKLANEFDEVEMLYKDYKNNYADCKTKSGSYNATTKTIIVYVPKCSETTENVIESASDDEIISEIVSIGAPKETAQGYLKLGSEKLEENLKIIASRFSQSDIEIAKRIISVLKKYGR